MSKVWHGVYVQDDQKEEDEEEEDKRNVILDTEGER